MTISQVKGKVHASVGDMHADLSSLMGQETRRMILLVLQKRPGATANEILERCSISSSTLYYHLDRLEKNRLIVNAPYQGGAHYFLAGVVKTAEEKAVLAALRHETAAKIFHVLLEKDSASKAQISHGIGFTPTTTNWHLKPMVESGLVKLEKRGRKAICSLANPEMIVAGMKVLALEETP